MSAWCRRFVGRVSFTGDLGYEIWVTTDYQRALYELLVEARREHGVKLVRRARPEHDAHREEFRHLGARVRPIYGPYEAGLGRFVDLKKGDFVGRAAALEEKESGGTLRLVDLQRRRRRMRMHAGMSPSGTTAGRGLGNFRGLWPQRQPFAGAWLHSGELADADAGFEIEIIGERRPARREAAAVVDPEGRRMRS